MKHLPSSIRLAGLGLLTANALSAETVAENTEKKITASTKLDTLVVTANRSGQTLFEQIQPASVLDGKNLLLNLEPSIGDTLDRLPGVASSSFAPGASRPIIRGLGEDRVRILQNGTSLIDVSNVSPDHNIAADPLSLRSIEIVRGPATLLYGSNTLGGVVNLMDDRIAEERFSGTNPTGSLGVQAGSVDDMLAENGSIKWGQGSLVFHLDAFRRDTENVEIPGFAKLLPDPGDESGTVPNSFTSSKGAGFGASHIFEKGFIGVSYSGFDSDYGTVGEEDVTIGLDQRRWEMRGAIYDPSEWIREVNFKAGYSDYTHTEFEGAEVGTVFENEGFNARTEVLHQKIGNLEGAFGFEHQATDFSADGDEAFLPHVESATSSLFVFEEYEMGKTRFQAGARYDKQMHESETHDLDFDAFSVSSGVIYTPVDRYAISFTTGYTQRPPTYVELLAEGPHVATNIFEQGDTSMDTENAVSLDLSVRKKYGRVTGSFGGYYYHFEDYINLQPTGAIDAGSGLDVYEYSAVGAEFYGLELETTVHLLAPLEEETSRGHFLDLIFRADYVHAEDRSSGQPLPRIAPLRLGTALEYGNGPWLVRIDGDYNAEQNRNASFETETDSFFLLATSLSYDLQLGSVNSTLFLRGVNLTNEEARLSTSFLKNNAPLAGRGVVVGMNTTF